MRLRSDPDGASASEPGGDGERAQRAGAQPPAAWLGHPAFLAAVATLALNDHVLKARWPGWWTGKLSDVAGVVVAAVLAAVLLGVRRGVVVAAVAFAALKVVPGVAEAAAPFLGGVTRRDPTDLLALLVLPPLARLLGRPAARPTGRAMPLAGLLVAAAASTATSCSPAPAVTYVGADGPALVAFVGNGGDGGDWAASTDGGRTWVAAPDLSTRTPPTVPGDPDPNATGALEACVDGVCWRIEDRRALVREGRDELRLSDARFDSITTGCADPRRGVLTALAAASTPAGPAVVATFGSEGVLWRDDAGRWHQAGVLSTSPVTRLPAWLEWVARRLGLVAGVPALALLVARWRRWRSPGTGVLAAVVGWVCTFAVSLFVALGGPEPDVPPGMLASSTVGIVLTAGTTAAVASIRWPWTLDRRAGRQTGGGEPSS